MATYVTRTYLTLGYSISNYFWKAGFCETPDAHHEDDSQESPEIWEYIQEKMNVTFTFEEYEEVDDFLPCTFQEIDDPCIENRKTETDDKNKKEEAAVCKPVPTCSKAL
jgi:hypothetical protein